MPNNNIKVLSLKNGKEKFHFVDFLMLIPLLWFDTGTAFLIPGFGAVINFALFILAAVLAILSDHKLLTRLTDYGFYWGALFFLSIAVPFYLSKGEFDLQIWNALYALIILFAFVYYSERGSKVQKIVVACLLIDHVLINVSSLVILQDNPDLARLVSTSGYKEYTDFRFGSSRLFTSFGHVYSMIFILPALVLILRNKLIRSSWSYIFFAIYILTSLWLVVSASYTICIVFTILFTIFALMASKKNDLSTLLRCLTLVIIITISLSAFLGFLIDVLFSENFEVKARMQELYSYFVEGQELQSGDLFSRIKHYKDSWNQFADNPFFGVYESAEESIKVGGHSEWLDALGNYGLIRIIIYIVFLVKTLRSVIRSRRRVSGMFLIYVSLAVIGWIVPVLFQEVYLALYIIIPFMIPPKEEKGKENEDPVALQHNSPGYSG